MAQTYSKAFRNCSTCDSWEGDRELDDSAMNITVTAPSTKGGCENNDGQDKMAYMSCPKWSEIAS